MFEWLEREISAIKTPRFHVVDGLVNLEMEQAICQSDAVVPESYKRFVLEFGNARLYRNSFSSYRLGVFAGPREAILPDGTRIFHLGFNGGASVYSKVVFGSGRLAVFEFETSEKQVAEDFGQWLEKGCAQARKVYTKKEWAEILHGPRPFTPEEQAIVELRRGIFWRVLGIDSEGNHIFEVTNTSCRMLPALTVGARSKNQELNGLIRLNVGSVGPGQVSVLRVDCYKKLMPPEEVEAFALPDPQPEDREYYYEFGNR